MITIYWFFHFKINYPKTAVTVNPVTVALEKSISPKNPIPAVGWNAIYGASVLFGNPISKSPWIGSDFIIPKAVSLELPKHIVEEMNDELLVNKTPISDKTRRLMNEELEDDYIHGRKERPMRGLRNNDIEFTDRLAEQFKKGYDFGFCARI